MYAPGRLRRELLASGLPVNDCRSGPRPQDAGLPPERWAIDWSSTPTPAQLAAAAAVLAAHDPDGDEKEETADVAALDGAIAQLGLGTAPDRLAAVEALLRRLVARLRRRGGA